MEMPGPAQLTSGLESLARRAQGLLIGALDQLQHGGHGIVIARVDVEENALQGHVLIGLSVSLLGTAGSSKA